MITELALATGLCCGYKYLQSNKRQVKKVINDVFENNNLDYKIIDAKENDIGCEVIVSLYGTGFQKLNDSKDLLESSLGYAVEIKQNDNLKTATINIVVDKLTDAVKFIPVKIKPHEIYVGQSYMRKNLIVNLNQYPHILVSGQTGCGKTEVIRLMLTNLIYNHTDRDINIYFSDLSDTNDFYLFQNLKQVKGYAKTIQESEQLFNYLMHLYSKRLDIFTNKNCKNVVEYNAKNYNTRMAYIYVVLDEFADYFPTNKLENDYELKVKCYNIIKHLVRKARKVGLILVIGIQRPDTTVLDPSLRSGLCCKIGFSQNTDSSSLVVCDTIELTNIEQRKALFMYGNVREWFRSLYIDDSIIKDYIKDSRISMYSRKDYNKFLNKQDVQVPIPKHSKPTKSKSKSKVKL